jgi:hypothetical protein
VLAVVTEGEIKQGMEEKYAKRKMERKNDRKINTDSRQQNKRRKERNK